MRRNRLRGASVTAGRSSRLERSCGGRSPCSAGPARHGRQYSGHQDWLTHAARFRSKSGQRDVSLQKFTCDEAALDAIHSGSPRDWHCGKDARRLHRMGINADAQTTRCWQPSRASRPTNPRSGYDGDHPNRNRGTAPGAHASQFKRFLPSRIRFWRAHCYTTGRALRQVIRVHEFQPNV